MKFFIALSLLIPMLAHTMSQEQQIWAIVNKGDKDALSAFLGKGRNPLANARLDSGRTLLHHCARNFKPDLIRLLVAAGADVNDCKNTGQTTPLIEAVDVTAMRPKEQNETVRLLMNLKADPTINNKQNQSVLEIANLYGGDRDFVPELKMYVGNFKK